MPRRPQRPPLEHHPSAGSLLLVSLDTDAARTATWPRRKVRATPALLDAFAVQPGPALDAVCAQICTRSWQAAQERPSFKALGFSVTYEGTTVEGVAVKERGAVILGLAISHTPH